jgi:nitroreductase
MADAETFIEFTSLPTYPPDEAARRARDFYEAMKGRRTVRDYSDEPVERGLIEDAIRAAGTAPSGANHQPWHFVAISDPELKRQIRVSAENEEEKFYGGRAGETWLDAIAHLGTNEKKPFLETAPWLIAVFAERVGTGPDGSSRKNYYVSESVGIATGFLIAALHDAGLATLTHTPSPMSFLGGLCGRPEGERPYLLLVVGHPAKGCQVPNITRKSLGEIASFR